MQLILTIENGSRPEMSGKTWRCGTEGGTVGRNPDCDLVLPDPKRYTSSVHAQIEFDQDGFTITDRSTNGTYHNSPKTLIGKNRSVSLDQGDKVFIGDFVLRVEVEADDFERDDAREPPAAAATSQFDGPGGDDRQNEAEDGGQESRPWDNSDFSVPWDNEGTEPGADDRDEKSDSDDDEDHSFSQSPEREFFAAPSASGGGGDAIPDDWDDFLTGFHDSSRLRPSESGPAGDADATPRSDNSEPDLDRERGSGSERDAGSGWVSGDPGSEKRRGADEDDKPFADAEPDEEERFDPPSQANKPSAPEPGHTQASDAGTPTRKDAADEVDDAPDAIPEVRPESPARAPAPARSRVSAAAVPQDQVSEILRVVTEGLMGLLQGRAEIKNEFRIAQTRFVQTENNPLKFSPDADEALKRILGDEESPGFLTGTRAFEDAFDDIQAHQLAILSAVQRAIESAVAQFDPAQIEKKLERISPISAKTPGVRAAKCWNLFSLHYEEVAGKMREDARQLFLAEFAEAYEEACRAVAQGRRENKS